MTRNKDLVLYVEKKILSRLMKLALFQYDKMSKQMLNFETYLLKIEATSYSNSTTDIATKSTPRSSTS